MVLGSLSSIVDDELRIPNYLYGMLLDGKEIYFAKPSVTA